MVKAKADNREVYICVDGMAHLIVAKVEWTEFLCNPEMAYATLQYDEDTA